MGRLMAVHLAKNNVRTEIYERSSPDKLQCAAHAAAAMLAPLAESAITEEPVIRMGLYSLPKWKTLIESLKKKVFFQQDGTLVLWHHQDLNEAKRFKALIDKTSQSIPSISPAQELNTKEIQALEPSLSDKFTQGYYLPHEGQLDNRQLLEALLEEIEDLSIPIHWNSSQQVSNFKSENAWVIDCRGLGAKDEWSNIRGVRGEVARVYAPEVKLKRPTRLIHPKYPIYIAPKENDLYVIGATEIESEDMSEVSVRSILELLSAAYTVHSGFAEARILEANSNCRPTLKNNLPEIQIHDGNIMKINGLYRHGFMISPAIVDAAIEIITQDKTDLAKELDIAVNQYQS